MTRGAKHTLGKVKSRIYYGASLYSLSIRESRVARLVFPPVVLFISAPVVQPRRRPSRREAHEPPRGAVLALDEVQVRGRDDAARLPRHLPRLLQGRKTDAKSELDVKALKASLLPTRALMRRRAASASPTRPHMLIACHRTCHATSALPMNRLGGGNCDAPWSRWASFAAGGAGRCAGRTGCG